MAPCYCSRVDAGADSDGYDKGGGTCAGSWSGKEMSDDVWGKACSSSSGDLATGDTAGLSPALHFVHEVHNVAFVCEAVEALDWVRCCSVVVSISFGSCEYFSMVSGGEDGVRNSMA